MFVVSAKCRTLSSHRGSQRLWVSLSTMNWLTSTPVGQGMICVTPWMTRRFVRWAGNGRWALSNRWRRPCAGTLIIPSGSSSKEILVWADGGRGTGGGSAGGLEGIQLPVSQAPRPVGSETAQSRVNGYSGLWDRLLVR